MTAQEAAVVCACSHTHTGRCLMRGCGCTAFRPKPARPTPHLDAVRAQRDELARALREIAGAAATALAHRLGQLAAADPTIAHQLAVDLALAVELLAEAHSGCAVTGCPRCLYLTDAAAVAQAWKDGPS